jgi:hypothetical protein
MRNTNSRKTTNIATPTTRITPYLIYAVTDSVFRSDVFGGVIGEYFVFSAVDTTKGKDVPSGLSGLHRKTPDGIDAQKPSGSCLLLIRRTTAIPKRSPYFRPATIQNFSICGCGRVCPIRASGSATVSSYYVAYVAN